VLWVLGETYTYQRDYKKATETKELLMTVTQDEELREKALYSMASDYLFNKDYDKAITEFTRFTNKYYQSLDYAGAQILLARAHQERNQAGDFAIAEELLNKVLDASIGVNVTAGFKPMAFVSLMSLHILQGDYAKALAVSDRFDNFNFKAMKAPEDKTSKDYSNFYKVWVKMYRTGAKVKKAEALRLRGDDMKRQGKAKESDSDFAESMKELNEVLSLEDDTTYTKSAISKPFPPMVYPTWGDDTGDWSKLLEKVKSGAKIDRTLKLRVDEYDSLQVKFANTFKTEATFTKAMTFISQGKADKAYDLLKLLGGSELQPTKDFLISPVVGVDPFLIAISPQNAKKYAELASAIINGKIPTAIKLYLDGKPVSFDSKEYFPINTEHNLEVKCLDFRGNEINPGTDFSIYLNGELMSAKERENYIVKFPSPNLIIWQFTLKAKEFPFSVHKSLQMVAYDVGLLPDNDYWFSPQSKEHPFCQFSYLFSPLLPKTEFNSIELKIYDNSGSVVKTHSFSVRNREGSIFDEYKWDGLYDDGVTYASGSKNSYSADITFNLANSNETITKSFKKRVFIVHDLLLDNPQIVSNDVLNLNSEYWFSFYIPLNHECTMRFTTNGQVEDNYSLFYENMDDSIVEINGSGIYFLKYHIPKLSSNSTEFSVELSTKRILIENKPWNGWFWPWKKDEQNPHKALYHDGGPLEKFDNAFHLSIGSGSKAWELSNHFIDSGDSSSLGLYSGHCDGFAKCSVFLPPPSTSVFYNEIEFKPIDVEGLFSEFFAQKQGYDFDDILTFTSINAHLPNDPKASPLCDDFHNSIIETIMKKGQPLIANLRSKSGSYEEVWNHAIYGFDSSFKQIDMKNKKIVEVEITIVSNEDKGCNTGFPLWVDPTNKRFDKYKYIIYFDKNGYLDYRNYTGSNDNNYPPKQKWISAIKYIPSYVAKYTIPLIPSSVSGTNKHLTLERLKKLKYWKGSPSWEEIFGE
jgi:tetratricopeptide (TPR) repeat protein